jgi:hypothetical protein
MSIIHEALKKAEKGIHAGIEQKPQLTNQQKNAKPKIKLYILYALVACVGLLVGNSVFSFLSSPKHPQVAKANVLPEPLSKPAEVSSSQPVLKEVNTLKDKPQLVFTLNGVFFSEGEGYALINNKIVKIGDEVGGAIVKKIDLDAVELETSGTTTKLYTQAR